MIKKYPKKMHSLFRNKFQQFCQIWTSNLVCMLPMSSLREKCPYSEFFWPVFSCIPTEYGEIFCIFLYSVRMRENTGKRNSEYGHFPRSDFQADYLHCNYRKLKFYQIHSFEFTLII